MPAQQRKLRRSVLLLKAACRLFKCGSKPLHTCSMKPTWPWSTQAQQFTLPMFAVLWHSTRLSVPDGQGRPAITPGLVQNEFSVLKSDLSLLIGLGMPEANENWSRNSESFVVLTCSRTLDTSYRDSVQPSCKTEDYGISRRSSSSIRAEAGPASQLISTPTQHRHGLLLVMPASGDSGHHRGGAWGGRGAGRPAHGRQPSSRSTTTH